MYVRIVTNKTICKTSQKINRIVFFKFTYCGINTLMRISMNTLLQPAFNTISATEKVARNIAALALLEAANILLPKTLEASKENADLESEDLLLSSHVLKVIMPGTEPVELDPGNTVFVSVTEGSELQHDVFRAAEQLTDDKQVTLFLS